MKLIFLIMFLPLFVFGQFINENPMTSGSDTCASTTSQDTLDWQIWKGGIGADTWNAVTNYITGAEKAAGTEQQISLADESGWHWGEMLKVRIRSEADTITSNAVKIGHTNGAITVFVEPDTSSTKCFYKVRIGGN